MNKLNFQKNGYVLVNDIFSKEEVNNILKLINEYVEKHKSKFEIYEYYK